MEKWYTFVWNDCSSTTFRVNEKNAYENWGLQVLREYSETTLREATEYEREEAMRIYKKDPYAEVDLEKLLLLDVFPCVTNKAIQEAIEEGDTDFEFYNYKMTE